MFIQRLDSIFVKKNCARFGSIGARLCCQPPTLPLYSEGKKKKTIVPQTQKNLLNQQDWISKYVKLTLSVCEWVTTGLHLLLIRWQGEGCLWIKPCSNGNVWQPNTIKHHLVTKHVDVVESSKRYQICLITAQTNKMSYNVWSNVCCCSNFIKHN